MKNNTVISRSFLLASELSIKHGQQSTRLNQFIGLIENCNFSVVVGTVLPQTKNLNNYNCYFIDLSHVEWADKIPTNILSLAQKHKVVLFNALKYKLSEQTALICGIKGIFYREEKPDITCKGLIRLQRNERWFRRETMDKALNHLLKNNDIEITQSSGNNYVGLTKRENTILSLVSTGAQNQEIAEHLHISPNTVKTHLYSIFRKTDSRNRVELITRSQNVIN